MCPVINSKASKTSLNKPLNVKYKVQLYEVHLGPPLIIAVSFTLLSTHNREPYPIVMLYEPLLALQVLFVLASFLFHLLVVTGKFNTRTLFVLLVHAQGFQNYA